MTKRDTEREISQAIIRFEKEYMGRGPLEAKVFIIEDMVLVRLKNVLTPAELKLSETFDPFTLSTFSRQVQTFEAFLHRVLPPSVSHICRASRDLYYLRPFYLYFLRNRISSA